MSYELRTTTDFGGNQITLLYRSDGLIIPVDSANADYQEYLEWVADGNTATTWSSSDTIPFTPTPNSEVMFTMEVI